MSSQPECTRCGVYLMHGWAYCLDCAQVLIDRIRERENELEATKHLLRQEKQVTSELAEMLRVFGARIEIANEEGDPILSAVLPYAKALLARIND